MTTNLPTGRSTAAAPVVAFQGEHGAFSEEACRQHFGQDVQTLPCRTFEDIFAAVDEGRADLWHGAGRELDGRQHQQVV